MSVERAIFRQGLRAHSPRPTRPIVAVCAATDHFRQSQRPTERSNHQD